MESKAVFFRGSYTVVFGMFGLRVCLALSTDLCVKFQGAHR